MTSKRLALFGLNALVGASMVLACGPAQTLAALAAEARAVIGTVAYDRARQALVVPVAGKAPTYSVRRLAPRQYVAEFAHAELKRDELQGQRLTSPMLAGWSLSESPDGTLAT